MMKNRKVLKFLFGFTFLISSRSLYVQELHEKEPHYVWFESDEVAIYEEGVYSNSNKGIMKLNVIEYDRISDRYKIQCRCLQMPYLDPDRALCPPYCALLDP